MSPAVASLVALLVAIALSLTSRVNVGVVAMAFAWVIGTAMTVFSLIAVIFLVAGIAILAESEEARQRDDVSRGDAAGSIFFGLVVLLGAIALGIWLRRRIMRRRASQ